VRRVSAKQQEAQLLLRDRATRKPVTVDVCYAGPSFWDTGRGKDKLDNLDYKNYLQMSSEITNEKLHQSKANVMISY